MTEKVRENFRIENQPAFVLQTYPWRETSLIVEIFTRDYGRVPLVAKGAKRPASKFRGLLNAFSPLLVNFSGKNEVKTLIDVNWFGVLLIHEKALMPAFYLNELIVRFTERLEPYPTLFSSYARTLKDLSQDETKRVVLRYFEMDLLQAIGYGLPESDFSNEWYSYSQGEFCEVTSPQDGLGVPVRGKTLRQLAMRSLSVGQEEKEARSLTREMIRYHMEDKSLNTRRIMEELARL